MGLRVHIVCAKCHASIEVHIVAGWDIKDVRHDCGRERPFSVSYDPPRRVY